MNKISFVAASLLILFSVSARAQLIGSSGSCYKPVQHIITINGVNTDKLGAYENLQSLQVALEKEANPTFIALKKSGGIKFESILNDTKNLTFDILESAVQKFAIFIADTNQVVAVEPNIYIRAVRSGLKNLGAVQLYAIGLISYEELNTVYVEPLKKLEAKAVEIIAAETRVRLIENLNPQSANELAQVVAPRLASYIIKGESILFVPHSQGNLYAAALYDTIVAQLTTLDEKSRLKVLNVASPTSYSPNKQSILQGNDLLISRLPGTTVTTNFASLSTLDPISNLIRSLIDNAEQFGDMTGHGFREVYLNNKLVLNPQKKTLSGQLLDSISGLLNNYRQNEFCTVFQSPTVSSLLVGSTAQLIPVIQYNGVALEKQPLFSFASESPEIASLVSGTIRGNKVGSTVITVSNPAFPTTGTFSVAVVERVNRCSVSGSETNDRTFKELVCRNYFLAGRVVDLHLNLTQFSSGGAIVYTNIVDMQAKTTDWARFKVADNVITDFIKVKRIEAADGAQIENAGIFSPNGINDISPNGRRQYIQYGTQYKSLDVVVENGAYCSGYFNSAGIAEVSFQTVVAGVRSLFSIQPSFVGCPSFEAVNSINGLRVEDALNMLSEYPVTPGRTVSLLSPR